MTPTPPKARMAKTRSARAKAGLCIRCGKPVASRVIEDAQGREVERRKMSTCERCR